jgi:antitoxin ParD1/3/4
MPSKHNLNVSLTEHLARLVADQVASGRFGTASEVVRAALRLLERDLEDQASARSGGGHGSNAGPHGAAQDEGPPAATSRSAS